MEEEEDASKKVRDESWEGGQEEELVDGGEVGLRKDPRALGLHHRMFECLNVYFSLKKGGKTYMFCDWTR